MSPMNRREFLHVATAATCAGLCGLSCASNDPAGVDASPSVPLAGASGPVDVGPLADYTREGPYDRFAEEGVLVIVHGARLIATSAVCTHKRATLTVKGGQIVCPKHGSRFGDDGVPLNGPASAPLNRYAVSVNGQGRVIVDRSTVFRPGHWDEPGSSLTLAG
jgi:nitrite reductase/ring-hydroxylating ferredoxin subunit